MKFGKLIPRKVTNIVATICQLKCAIFDFGWRSTTDHAVGAYSVPQTPKLDLRGLVLRSGSVAEWLAYWTQALGSNRSSDAVG